MEVDVGAPQITVENPGNKTYGYKTVDLNVTTSEPVESCWWNTEPDKDQTPGNETMTGSGTDWDDTITVDEQGTYRLKTYCNDSAGNVGVNETVYFTVSTIKTNITKGLTPDAVVAREVEKINVTTDVEITNSNNNISFFNITDEVPYDFEAPSVSGINVTNIEYSPFGKTDITDEVTVNVVDQGGQKDTLIMVNVTNMSKTSAGYLQENDTIRIEYEMNSSKMSSGSNRTVMTNVSLKDVKGSEEEAWYNRTINVWEVVLRGTKKIWHTNLSNPQDISVRIKLKAIGGSVTDILMADYLPEGVNIYEKRVTYHNETNDVTNELYNGSDYLLEDKEAITLPSGIEGTKYNYNFSYKFTNWNGILYDNDSITLQYNVSVLGGGQWVLPGIVSAYDPTYKEHIKTEMYASANVPSFDVSTTALSDKVRPGEEIEALTFLVNVGG
ncbi:MAG: hypothetical protein ABEJ72_09145, partial [Candidatus Aenigmatarchaeota archaeon]